MRVSAARPSLAALLLAALQAACSSSLPSADQRNRAGDQEGPSNQEPTSATASAELALTAHTTTYKFCAPTTAGTGPLDLFLDLTVPAAAGAGKPPVIVLVHGGGLTTGTRDDTLVQRIAAAANAAGYATASIDYRLGEMPVLAGELNVGALWPAMLEDARCAVRWLRGNATALRIDAERVAFWGMSAGAQISLVSALRPEWGVIRNGDLRAANALQSSAVAAVVDWYGPKDYAALYNPVGNVVPPSFAVMGGAPGDSPLVDARYASASPVNFVSSDDPPVLTVHGTADTTVPLAQSAELFAMAAQRAGLQWQLRTLEGAGHRLLEGSATQANQDEAIGYSLEFLDGILTP